LAIPTRRKCLAKKNDQICRFWINVVSYEHVLKGVEWGIIQSCHGKSTPLKRMSQGDWVIHYSPKDALGGKIPCQKFTSIGQISDEEVYEYDMGGGFVPWRRNVKYLQSYPCSIVPMLEELSFTKGRTSWGYMFRLGFFEITETDFKEIFWKMVGIPFAYDTTFSFMNT